MCCTLQHTATHCNTRKNTAGVFVGECGWVGVGEEERERRLSKYSAATLTHTHSVQHCNTLQQPVTPDILHTNTYMYSVQHCNMLQQLVTLDILHATHYIALQDAATHYSTLQHAATRCNTYLVSPDILQYSHRCLQMSPIYNIYAHTRKHTHTHTCTYTHAYTYTHTTHTHM